MTAYYNEHDPFAATWLEALIDAQLVAPGIVDRRSIEDVLPNDLAGFTQCHFFAGIGGWSHALRRARWPDDRAVWTGSCPCQPFSAAGKRVGFADERHLWPAFHHLIGQREPAVVFGEQVAGAAQWLGLVRSDLETLGYAVGAIPVEAASAGAYHFRDRFFFVADRNEPRPQGRPVLPECTDQRPARQGGVGVADAAPLRRGHQKFIGHPAPEPSERRDAEHATQFGWVIGIDGKARRTQPGICLLANGFPARVGLLRGFGNAIDPRPAAAFIAAYVA